MIGTIVVIDNVSDEYNVGTVKPQRRNNYVKKACNQWIQENIFGTNEWDRKRVVRMNARGPTTKYWFLLRDEADLFRQHFTIYGAWFDQTPRRYWGPNWVNPDETIEESIDWTPLYLKNINNNLDSLNEYVLLSDLKGRFRITTTYGAQLPVATVWFEEQADSLGFLVGYGIRD